MKFRIMRATKTAGFLLFAALANPLMAQTPTDEILGWYMGGNIGVSAVNIDEDQITADVIDASYSDNENDLAYKLFGGYQFSKYFALEGGYFNLGKFDYALSTPTSSLDGSLRVMGANLDAVGILPITEDFSAFARVGAIYAQTRDSFSATGSISVLDTTPEKNDINYKFGAGLQYAITDTIGVRLEAERYRVNDAVGSNGDIDFYSIGLTYKFGTSKEVAFVAQREEEKVVVAPKKKEEVIILLTQADAHEKIQESLTQEKTVLLLFEEIHFEFDKSLLSPEAKEALIRDITPLNMNPTIKMRATGHTSARGTKEYNQGLSERRAQAVKDYLVQEKLIEEENISVVGYGMRKPAVYEADPSNIYSKAAKANMRVLLKIIQD